MTDITKFAKELKKRNFTTFVKNGFVFARQELTPKTYRTDTKSLCYISNISITVFSGSDTPKGKLGCVCFFFGGKEKQYRKKTISHSEILKEVILPTSSQEAIQNYDMWDKEAKDILSGWKSIFPRK